MRILACIKRVPSPGAAIPLTDDGAEIDTRHLGFTISPHEECAVEEAVSLVERHGGHATICSVGPAEVDEQIRAGLAAGADAGVRVAADTADGDPRHTAALLAHAIAALETDDGPFDLLLFGDESADAAHRQVPVRVAARLGRPVVGGVGALTVDGARVVAWRATPDGRERIEVTPPLVLAVKEGLNLPRYPSLRGRMRAAKAALRVLEPDVAPPAAVIARQRLRRPPDERREPAMLGHGAAAAPAVVAVLEQEGLA